MLRTVPATDGLAVVVLALALAGCASDSGELPEVPTPPTDSSKPVELPLEERVVEGDFWLAGQVVAGGESQFLRNGESRFDVVEETRALTLTLTWSSPTGDAFILRLGSQEGGFIGEPAAGPSPLIFEATENISAGAVDILVDPANGRPITPYQEFHWEVVLLQPAEDVPPPGGER